MKEDDPRATAVRALAQHVVILGLVRSHPDQEQLRRLVQQFAEATRANLLASNWSDELVQQFDDSLDRLLNTPPPPSSR